MTPELLLVLALLSLAASIAFAYMAYRVWRKKGPEEAGEIPGSEPEALPAEQESPPLPARAAEAPGAAAVAPPEAEAPSAPAPVHERVIPVATLLRDEVTGGLVVRVGEREYRTAKDLLDSKDRRRMEYTATELSRWLGVEKAGPRPGAAEPAARPAAPRRPTSMVEQINEILDRKLLERPQLKRGVRLSEGPGGAIKVYIGIDSYNAIDDVPDADVRQLIRDAVAEWETEQ
jgi:hypothetical protein